MEDCTAISEACAEVARSLDALALSLDNMRAWVSCAIQEIHWRRQQHFQGVQNGDREFLSSCNICHKSGTPSETDSKDADK
jgi:mono/diheme cytochrome c family protein